MRIYIDLLYITQLYHSIIDCRKFWKKENKDKKSSWERKLQVKDDFRSEGVKIKIRIWPKTISKENWIFKYKGELRWPSMTSKK